MIGNSNPDQALVNRVKITRFRIYFRLRKFTSGGGLKGVGRGDLTPPPIPLSALQRPVAAPWLAVAGLLESGGGDVAWVLTAAPRGGFQCHHNSVTVTKSRSQLVTVFGDTQVVVV